MKINPSLMIGLLFSLPVCGLMAQTNTPPSGGPPGGGHHHRPPPMPIVVALDTNKDGIISAAEIANAPAALKTLDKNGDGQLTKDEYLPAPPDGQDGPPPGDDSDASGKAKHKRPLPPIVAALDTNGDGVISADEIANASAALLKLDKNGDGQLTMDEYMGPRPRRGPGGQGGQGGGPGGMDDQGGPGGPGGQRPPPPDDNK